MSQRRVLLLAFALLLLCALEASRLFVTDTLLVFLTLCRRFDQSLPPLPASALGAHSPKPAIATVPDCQIVLLSQCDIRAT